MFAFERNKTKLSYYFKEKNSKKIKPLFQAKQEKLDNDLSTQTR